MKRIAFIVIGAALAGALALAGPPAQQSRSAEVLLGQALHQEEVEGNLDAAIATYKKIVAEYPGNRPVAAKALLEMGRCYEKLGKDEARKAYQRLLRDYADQSEAKVARSRLAALRRPPRPGKTTAFTTRQVWTSPDVGYEGAPSPDGRYLSFVDWTTGDLAVRDLETTKNRRLTNNGLPKGRIERFAEFSRWSPDGRQIAYDWYDGKCCIDLRVISREGGKPRTLLDNRNGGWMQTYDWSPDGKQILVFLEKKDGTRQIVLVSAADGSTRVLKTFEGRGAWPQIMRFSRDGRYIAYDWPQKENSAQYDIFLISVDGSREIPLVRHPADDRLLGWPPGDKGILFASDRTGSQDVWFLPVSEGKPQGAPELVKGGVEKIVPMGFTRSGSFYYAQGQWMLDVYVAAMDPQSGRILAPPKKAIKHFEGRNSWPAYSPDGKSLAYLTTRNRSFTAAGNPNIVCIRSLETGKEREFTTKFRRLAGTSWSPNGRLLYLAAWGERGMGIYRVNAQTGKFTPIVRTEPPAMFVHHKVTPDGSALVYEERDNQMEPHPQYRIVRRNLTSGKEKLLYAGPRAAYSFSPDGRQLAFITEDRVLRVMPAVGGKARELFRSKEKRPSFAWLAWTADGKYILFPRLRSAKARIDQQRFAVWRIPAKGGEPQPTGIVMSYIQSLSVDPDGRHVAFDSLGRTTKAPAIWVMDNFLRPKVASK